MKTQFLASRLESSSMPGVWGYSREPTDSYPGHRGCCYHRLDGDHERDLGFSAKYG